MNLVMWVLVAVLVGLVAQHAMTRGGYGRWWDIALVSPDPGIVVMTIVAAVGAAGLIVTQRMIWPAIG